ncbi:MAG: SET domain-containing protein [Verrucomicrobiae bacterium]|nr:SET domain-containing protein [Verrucomicrobiae bacterium]
MENRKLTTRDLGTMGRGVYATAKIFPGEFIARFDGKIYYWDWPNIRLPNDAPEYVFEHAIPFADNYVRDSTGLARLVNHSCKPNCRIQDLFSIVAMHPIEAGQQLTWDYDTAQDDSSWFMHCNCGARECRQIIRGYSHLTTEQKHRCSSYTSEWILAKSVIVPRPSTAIAPSTIGLTT